VGNREEAAMANQVGVLGIVGSPREGGNTDTLVTEVLRGAEAAGARSQKVFVGRYKIAPCTGCGGCVKTGRCVSRDGMDDLLPLMEANHVWVLGTPVYWWGATAQMKLFIDRWFAPWVDPKTREVFRNRVAVVVTPLGDTNATVARHTTGMFGDIFAFLGIPIAATVVAPNVGGSGIEAGADVLKRPEIMKAAHDAGRAAAEMARST
jgi:multimeric flavodoxin WrbA